MNLSNLDPNYLNSYFKKGLALINLKKYEDAIESYNRAIELDPNFKEAYLNKGIAKFNLNKNEDAIECLNKAIELDPNLEEAYLCKAYALWNLRQYQDAIELFNKEIQLDRFFCNNCDKSGITRYKCSICFDYDLCEEFKNNGFHIIENHVLYKISK